LEKQGVLVSRSNEQLERELAYFYVSTRDGMAVACAQLIPYGDEQCEVACITTHPEYRRTGRADHLVESLERDALRRGFKSVFALTTRTMGWFAERGYVEVDPEGLPSERLAVLEKGRGSKVYRKELRELDSVAAAP
jgi:amino-acid N-acetyltransferase